MRTLYSFTTGKGGNPVEKLYAFEDLGETLVNATIIVDDNTLYPCFINALPAECALEIRDLSLEQVHDKKEVLNLVRSQYETLLPTFGKSKGSLNSLALVGKEDANMVVEVVEGTRRAGLKRGKRVTTTTRTRQPEPQKCFSRCRATSHCSGQCTTQLYDRCGGRGHQSSKSEPRLDMENGPSGRLCLRWSRIPTKMP